LVKQIVDKFDVLISGGKSEAKIELRPKQLGELKIHLVVEDGAIKAILNAPSHHVKQMLEANISTLKQSLEDQGLQVKEFNVSVDQHQSNHGHNFRRSHYEGHAIQHTRIMVAREQAAMTMAGFGSDKAVNYLA
jgi:flagellar hook-length control protein FliK